MTVYYENVRSIVRIKDISYNTWQSSLINESRFVYSRGICLVTCPFYSCFPGFTDLSHAIIQSHILKAEKSAETVPYLSPRIIVMIRNFIILFYLYYLQLVPII